MAAESSRGPNLHDLEALRIARSDNPPPRNRLVIVALTAVVLALGMAAAYETYTHTLGRPLEVQTAPVLFLRTERQQALLTGTGYVVTRDKYIIVGTKILGQIVAEPIEEGKQVRRGDLLARIDDRDYQAQLNQAIADRDLAAANLKLAQVKARRERVLYQNGVASQDELDVAINALAVAAATLKRADAAIDYARFNVNQCVVTSPIDGVVLAKYREVGDTINYGGDIQAGGGSTDIAQLAATDDMRVEADISENDIAKVVMGMPATIALDAYPDRSFDGNVVKIYPEADRQKGTVKVEVRILKPDLAIVRPEMSARVTFLAGAAGAEQPPVLLVPKNAVIRTGGRSFVWTVRDGAAWWIPIVAGSDFERGVSVESGLDDGATVIIDAPASLKNGQKVISNSAS